MVRASHILLSIKDPADPNPNMTARRDLPEDQKRARRKQMEDILKRAKGGEDFSKLASQYSDDPGSKDRGGEYTFPRGQMAPEFETAAFSLNTNQISDIVTTVFGYHIIKLNEKMPARTANLDDEVAFAPAGYMVIKKYWSGPPEITKSARKLSAIIRQNLEGQQRQKLFPEFMAKIKKEAGVVILDDKLKLPENAAVSAPPGGQPPSKTELK
jgi:parvulin-like peptidyl-prolyl isomerase